MEQKLGKVTLVGAGCGKGLITCKGLQAVRQADVLVYDDLLDNSLLLEAKPDCVLHAVGKRAGRHSAAQREIEAYLIEQARKGKHVVRLKGGDSYVFGRGGEEMLALQAAGIPAEIIPGVTAGIAVPEHLGIPVTHRGAAQSVTFVTGNSAAGFSEDWSVLAKLQGTIVFYMGLQNAPVIAKNLIANGKSPDTPVSILSNGYRIGEQRLDGTLQTLPALAAQAETPALLLLGETARLHLPSRLPSALEGVSVSVVGTKHFTGKTAALLEEQGAVVQQIPCAALQEIPAEIPADFQSYDWIVFTSANGVAVFFRHLAQSGVDYRRISHLKFACIGPGTAEKLKTFGFTSDFLPSSYTAECFGRELAKQLSLQERVLILRAEQGSAKLCTALDEKGISYEDRKIYRLAPAALPEQLLAVKGDYLVFGSAGGVKAFLDRAQIPASCKIVCIGAETAKALPGTDMLLPKSCTIPAIVDCILENAGKKNTEVDCLDTH